MARQPNTTARPSRLEALRTARCAARTHFALAVGLLTLATVCASAEPPAAPPGYLPLFERLEAWSLGSNYAYNRKPGVDPKWEVGPASPSGRPSAKVSFGGAGWAPKPYERDIYLTLAARIDRRPKTITWSVWGDGANETLELHLRDNCGETVVWHIRVDWKGWRTLELDGTKPSGAWGGNQDNQKGVVDPPIVRMAIDIMEGPGSVPGRRELAFADLCITADAAAPGEDPRPAACMGPAAVPPAIDGRLDDPCWTVAARVTELVTSSGSPFKVPHATTALVTYDTTNLYVAFRCHDEPGHKLFAEKRTRDGAVWEDDSVEVMVAPPGDKATFHHIIINPLGDIYDERWLRDATGPGGRWDGAWNAAGLKTATAVDEAAGGYSVELALPLADLAATEPVAGQPWRLNLSRMRRMGDKNAPAEASSWGGSQHFQSTEAPGWMWPGRQPLHVDVPPVRWQVGANELKLRIANPDRGERVARVEVIVCDQAMRMRPQSRELRLAAGAATDIALPVELTTGDDSGHVRVQVLDATDGVPLYRNLVRPLSVRHLFEFDTDAVAYGPEEDFCRVRVHMALSPEELVPCVLAATWTRRGTGKQVYRQVFDYFYDDPMCVAVSLPPFPPGVYDIVATLTGAGGKVLEERRFAITRLPAREHQLEPVTRVDLGPNREIRVNGKPFFPLGVHHFSPEELPTLKRWGFNCVPVWVGPSRDAVPAVDRVWQAGMYTELGLCDLGYNWSSFIRDPQGCRQRMREKVTAVRQHPGLCLYQLGDELANDRIDEFVPLYQEVKTLDPAHLQSMSTGPCWLSADQIRKRATVSDIVSPDLYNVGRGPLTEHPRLCDAYLQALAAVPGKGLTKIPQVTGYSLVGYRLPTPEELRYMVYADIVHGVKGFSYYKWGAHSKDPGPETGMRHNYRLLSAVRQLNWEIADLSDTILGGTPVEVARGRDCGKDVELWCRAAGGRTALWVINHSNLPQRVCAVAGGLKPGARAEVFYEDRELTVSQEGELAEELLPYAVHIYVWASGA